MTLKEKIDSNYKEAYKERDEQKIAILRIILSSIKNTEIDIKRVATDDDVIKVIKREIKQRYETIESLKKASRKEDVKKEECVIDFLKDYLPEELDENTVREIVKEAISELSASDIKDLGKVIPLAIKKSQGKAEGSVVSKIAKEELIKN